MSDENRQLHLNLFGNWHGNHRASWRHPSVDPRQLWDFDFNVRTAQLAEKGLFDAIFFAGGPGGARIDPAAGQIKPEEVTLIAALAAITSHIGVAATVSTTYTEPYNTARQIASIDVLSGGRAGWNAVTGSNAAPARNFGTDAHPAHADRYARSEEFIQIVKALWDSWEPDAIVADQKSGIFLDTAKVHSVPFKGQFFDIDATLNVPRSPQGRPVIFHAGDSEFGRNQGARHSDAIFTAQPTIELGRNFYADFKRRVVEQGRNPEHVHVFPGFLGIIGSTEEEAQRRFDELNELIDINEAVRSVARADGLDVSDVPLDEPIPDHVWQRSAETSVFKSRVEALRQKAIISNLTARQVIEWNIAAHGHYVHVGTPEQVADQIELWFRTGAADGLNYKVPTFPDGLEIFVEHVVPLLQKKGIYRHEYAGTTLRENLGLPIHPES